MGKNKKEKQWSQKSQGVYSDEDDDGDSPMIEDEGTDGDQEDMDFDDNLFKTSKRGSKDAKGVFEFDSASESDDEKMLDERLRQFERVHLKGKTRSDTEEETDDEDYEDYSERPTRNRYGGIADDRFLDIVEDDGGAEPSAAILEEQEAKLIQKRLANLVSETDVDLELLGVPIGIEATEQPQKETTVPSLSKMSSEKQLSIVDQQYPELKPLISRIKDELECLTLKWLPLIKLLDEKINQELCSKIPRSALMFVQARHLIGFTYCMNGLFYLRLRARHEPVEGHPVTTRLVNSHKLLEELVVPERHFMKPGKRLDALLNAHLESSAVPEMIKLAEKLFTIEKLKSTKDSGISNSKHTRRAVPNAFSEDDEMKETSDNDALALLEDDSLAKRKLTEQMDKNYGTKPPRPNAKRNPRVANRNKFAKALKRRRAAGVREYQAPVNNYVGELHGVRASVRRSTKLKM